MRRQTRRLTEAAACRADCRPSRESTPRCRRDRCRWVATPRIARTRRAHRRGTQSTARDGARKRDRRPKTPFRRASRRRCPPARARARAAPCAEYTTPSRRRCRSRSPSRARGARRRRSRESAGLRCECRPRRRERRRASSGRSRFDQNFQAFTRVEPLEGIADARPAEDGAKQDARAAARAPQ